MKVERWDTCEIELTGSGTYENPFQDVELTGTFTHRETGKSVTVNGFYDGGSTWRARFMPDVPGVWDYSTKSPDSGLDGQKGEILCINQEKSYLHGPLCAKGFHFFHADGTPRLLISTRLSCQFSTPDVWEKVIDYFKLHRINRVLFMMVGIAGTTKDLYGEKLDFWKYNVEKFQAIDNFIDALRKADIIASPYFYYFNDRVQRGMTPEQDKAYIRYGMARFGAYANVMPVLSNEVEQKFTEREGQYNLASHDWANQMGNYLSELAVFNIPVGIHNPMETSKAINPGFYTILRDWPFPWTDFMLRQAQVAALSAAREIRDDIPEQKEPIYNLRGYARHNQLLIDLRRFGIPVINEEPGYEMEGHQSDPKSERINLLPWNSQTSETLIPTFWTAITAGAYAMWGNFCTYYMDDPLDGIKKSITPEYLKVLHDFMMEIPYWEMEPLNEAVSPGEIQMDGESYRTNFCLAKAGKIYLIFFIKCGEIEVNLPPGKVYQAIQMDPRTGKQTDLGKIDGGQQTIKIFGMEQVILLK